MGSQCGRHNFRRLTTNSPLNVSAGAGQLDGLQFSKQYLAGQNGPGNVPSLGWDLNNVQTTLVYHLGPLQPGSTLETTLDWFRHVAWTDNNGNGIIDSSDFFSQLSPLANLDLFVYRDNQLIAQSVSMIDNVEELNLTNLTAGNYDIRVNRTSGIGDSEQFGLAWSAVAVPNHLPLRWQYWPAAYSGGRLRRATPASQLRTACGRRSKVRR